MEVVWVSQYGLDVLRVSYGQVPHGIDAFKLVARTNQSVLGGNFPIFQKQLNKIIKMWCSILGLHALHYVFIILVYLFKKYGNFFPRGIKIFFFKKFDQKLFAAWRTRIFL